VTSVIKKRESWKYFAATVCA